MGDAIAPFVSGECGSFFFAQLLSSATNKCQTNTRRVGQIPFPCYLCICAPQGFARVVPPLACHSMLISVYNEDSRFFGCHGVSLQTLTTLGSISKEGLKADDQFPPTDQHQCCVINTMSPPNTTSLRPTKKERTVRECQTFLCVGLFRHTNPSCVSFLFAKTCGSAPLSVYGLSRESRSDLTKVKRLALSLSSWFVQQLPHTCGRSHKSYALEGRCLGKEGKRAVRVSCGKRP